MQSASEGSVGQALLENLEKNSANCDIVQTNPKWFRSRVFLSWDFPSVGSEVNSAPLGNMPTADQERFLVEELLYVLSGFDGDYIRALPVHSEVEERKFDVDDSNSNQFF